ncbi:5'-nucleotidase C-terminal domain-containing protein [Lentibacillus sp. Marseille-P4043]|uniref:5'-nucleotidase C-terminal domain-containing protein n=1 Tax=Lentibacillus sp. Marseille-P4043 TaxID=2040293 RepID=UPI000D0B250A|nr:5'-nucleotidase C-terminal domain-containing protein [Lentibacillus sp. Marseille-P4043]
MKSKKNIGKFTGSTLTAAAAASMAFVPVASAETPDGYTDVAKGDSHYDAIMALTKDGIVKGFEDGSFGQWQNINRQQVAVILYEAFNLTPPEDMDSILESYDDVDSDHLYAKQIAAVTETGIFKGSDGSFAPDEKITREQVASVILLAENLADYHAIDGKDINLENVGESHKERVQILADLAITNQTDDFRPHEDITRGAFSTLFYKLMNKADELNDKDQLDLMHTSDTHAHVDNGPKRVTAAKNFRSAYPNALLLDSGDVFSGTLYFNKFYGQADMAIMNLMGYDAMTFGNHEFDLGQKEGNHEKLAEFIDAANFPIVSSNVNVTNDENLSPLYEGGVTSQPEESNIYDGIIKNVDGEKVGIFGLTTEETENISSPLNVTFDDYVATAQKMVTEFEAKGVDKIVAVTHIGYNDNPDSNDINLAKAVDGIDVILGGHSHTELDEPAVVIVDAAGQKKAPTIIDHTFQYSNFLGTLNVKFDDHGKIIGHAAELVSIDDQEPDAEAEKVLAPYKDEIDETMEKETGATAAHPFDNPRGDVSVRNSETALGNLITDGMLKKAKTINSDTIIALQNGGGIRTNIDEGPITYGEIMEVLPFGNTLATMEITGAELQQAFEHSVANVPSEFGGFLHISGMKLTYDSSKDTGERVVSMELADGTPIDPDQTYVAATNAFTAMGGDGYEVFEEIYKDGRVQDLGLSDWENLKEHVVDLGTVETEIEGRIVDQNK